MTIPMSIDIISISNIIGIIAFAFSGAMKAIRSQLDLLGILALGIVYALGGGVLRDVLIQRIPYVFSANRDVAIAILGVIVAITIYRLKRQDVSNRYYIIVPDALGLAAFTIAGAVTADQATIPGIGLIFLAVVTAVGGGIIGDLLMGRIPAVLQRDCYATCSIVGAICFYIALRLGVNLGVASLLGGGITFLIRLLAIQGRWHLPKLS